MKSLGSYSFEEAGFDELGEIEGLGGGVQGSEENGGNQPVDTPCSVKTRERERKEREVILNKRWLCSSSGAGTV